MEEKVCSLALIRECCQGVWRPCGGRQKEWQAQMRIRAGSGCQYEERHRGTFTPGSRSIRITNRSLLPHSSFSLCQFPWALSNQDISRQKAQHSGGAGSCLPSYLGMREQKIFLLGKLFFPQLREFLRNTARVCQENKRGKGKW